MGLGASPKKSSAGPLRRMVAPIQSPEKAQLAARRLVQKLGLCLPPSQSNHMVRPLSTRIKEFKTLQGPNKPIVETLPPTNREASGGSPTTQGAGVPPIGPLVVFPGAGRGIEGSGVEVAFSAAAGPVPPPLQIPGFPLSGGSGDGGCGDLRGVDMGGMGGLSFPVPSPPLTSFVTPPPAPVPTTTTRSTRDRIKYINRGPGEARKPPRVRTTRVEPTITLGKSHKEEIRKTLVSCMVSSIVVGESQKIPYILANSVFTSIVGASIREGGTPLPAMANFAGNIKNAGCSVYLAGLLSKEEEFGELREKAIKGPWSCALLGKIVALANMRLDLGFKMHSRANQKAGGEVKGLGIDWELFFKGVGESPLLTLPDSVRDLL